MRCRLVLLSLLALVHAANAAPETESAAAERIKATIEERYPGSVIESILPAAAIPGWYEVVTSANVAYTDAKADYLLIGNLTDTRTKEDLSGRRWSQLHAIDFKTLPFDRAIKVVKGDGSRVLAVFADPDCPYCRKLEHELQGLTNLTLYTFLFPITELHPEAIKHAEQIWCATDAAASWAGWLLQNTPLADKHCDNTPVAELAALGAKLKITGTPTLFLADGTRVIGAIDKADLERRLVAASAVPREVSAPK